MPIPHQFLDALVCDRRAPEFAEVDDIFGWMIGSWEMDAVVHNAGGHNHEVKGEMHASWVLEGRAIQDLFIFPRRADRHSGIPLQDDRYGTTIRTYDKKLKAWRVNFINPASDETSAQLLARRNGNCIDMQGHLSDGTPVRWRYESFTASSFHYVAEKLQQDGKSWRLYLELFGKRSDRLGQAA